MVINDILSDYLYSCKHVLPTLGVITMMSITVLA